MQHDWSYDVQTSNADELVYETAYVGSWTEDCRAWSGTTTQRPSTPRRGSTASSRSTCPRAMIRSVPRATTSAWAWASYQPASCELVVDIDDVVLDDERVGCGR